MEQLNMMRSKKQNLINSDVIKGYSNKDLANSIYGVQIGLMHFNSEDDCFRWLNSTYDTDSFTDVEEINLADI